VVLLIYRNYLLGHLSTLFLGDDVIPYVFKAKNLRITVSYDLNWGDHVGTICRKLCGALAGRRRLFDRISDLSDSILGCFLLTYKEFHQ
jgi:hypothetical protein